MLFLSSWSFQSSSKSVSLVLASCGMSFAEWVSISLRSSDCSTENSSPWVSSMRKESLTWILYSPFSYTVMEMESFLSLLAAYLFLKKDWGFFSRSMAIQFLPQHLLKGYCARFYLISCNIIQNFPIYDHKSYEVCMAQFDLYGPM